MASARNLIHRGVYLLFAVLIAAGLCTGTAWAELPTPVTAALAREKLHRDGLSVWIQAVDAAEPLITHNVDITRNPASVMKLVTTLAALNLLGPDFRWKTQVYRNGAVQGGRLAGDLHLAGGGDPYLLTESFWRMLRSIHERGIAHIAGDLVIDGSYFDVARADPGAFDGKPYLSYNTLPHPLLLNFNTTRFHFRPDQSLGRIVISTDPPLSGLLIDNTLRLVRGTCRGKHAQMRMKVDAARPGSPVQFAGDYPGSCGSYAITRSVFEPEALTFDAFKTMWTGLGGTIGGRLRIAPVPQSAQPVFAWKSRPLIELVQQINKHSNNVMARQLLLTLGAERGGIPGTVGKGREAIRSWLETYGVEPPGSGLFIDNGSGLSRDARITARSLAGLLSAAFKSPLMAELVASMPLAATDGTIRKRFRDGPLAGRLHAKTGYLDHVRTIAGYLHARDGGTWIVVMLHNARNVHLRRRGTKVQDALLTWLWKQ